MRLLVLGASGGCGRWFVRLAAEHGHDIHALVRPGTFYEVPAGVTAHRGEVLEPGTIDGLLPGCDGVACCLGIRRAGPSPWARRLSPADLMERAAGLLVEGMLRRGVERVVAISAGGVGDSRAMLSAPVKWLIGRGNIGAAYRDLEMMERALGASGLDWLAARPVTLVNGPPTGGAGRVERYGLLSMVRRSDVAAWMLERLERDRPFGERAVLVGTER